MELCTARPWLAAAAVWIPLALPAASAQGLFDEAAAPTVLTGHAMFDDAHAFVDPVEGVMTPYVPPEVSDPDFGNGVAHPVQCLTRFYPMDGSGNPVVPGPDDRFPTLV